MTLVVGGFLFGQKEKCFDPNSNYVHRNYIHFYFLQAKL